MKRIISTVVAALFGVALLKAETVDTLRLSTLFTTHVVFRTELVYADLSNTKLIAAKIIEQNRCMLALKAREPFTTSASVSALESDGTIHTFVIAYDERPSSLVVDLREQRSSSVQDTQPKAPQAPSVQNTRQRIFHIGDKAYDLRLLCEDIYISGDNTCFVLSLRNRGGISYEAGDATFVVESRKKGKRSVQFERNLYPLEKSGSLSTPPGATSGIVYRFDKTTITKDQVLKVYLYETGGQRNLVLTLSHRDINKARRK